MHGGFGPSADSCTAANYAYSITSSAMASIVGGTVRPNAPAVLTLITNSNLVGCMIGKSAGRAPLRILSTKSAARRKSLGRLDPRDCRPPATTKSRIGQLVGKPFARARVAIFVRLATVSGFIVTNNA